MDDKAEEITSKLASFNKNDSLKLYCDIFMLLTKENTLVNYSKNNSGIRFKLHEFNEATLDSLILLINNFELTNKEGNTSFIQETIKSKPKSKKKIK